MATTDTLQEWLYVALTLKEIESGDTITVKLSNRIIDDADNKYHPLIKSISGMGRATTGGIPQSVVGSLILDDSPNSFGYERKFSDLLQRYTIINQIVIFYVAFTELSDTDVTADFEQVFKAQIKNYLRNDNSLILNIESTTIPKDSLSAVITSDLFPDSPTAALGKHMPLVFGRGVEVAPLRIDYQYITAIDTAYMYYAVATEFTDTFELGGSSLVGIKALDIWGNYVSIINYNTLFTTAWASHTSGNFKYTPGRIIHAQLMSEYESDSAYSNCVFTSGKVRFAGENNGSFSADGDLVFYVFEVDESINRPGETVATARVDKAPYQSNVRASGTFYVEFTFDRPAVLDADKSYAFGFSQTCNANTDTWSLYVDTTSTITGWVTHAETFGTMQPVDGWQASASYYSEWNYYFYAMQFGIRASVDDTSRHLSIAGVYAACVNYTNELITGFDNFNFVAVMDGLKDDSSGSITGTPGTVMIRPDHIIRTLLTEWDGSDWVETTYDSSAYSDTLGNAFSSSDSPYYRRIDGKTMGRVIRSNLIDQVCRESACFVSLYNSSSAGESLGIYAWGDSIAESMTLTDEDITIISIQRYGVESVINHADVFYGNNISDAKLLTITSEGNLINSNYHYSLSEASEIGESDYCKKSTDLYGTRELSNTSFLLLNADVSAAFIAKYYCSKYPFPFCYVTFQGELSLLKDINIFDVVKIVHPDLPAFFGSSADAKLPTYNGDVCENIIGGHYFKRAELYRAQVEQMSFLFDVNGFSRVQVTARILENYPIDPT